MPPILCILVPLVVLSERIDLNDLIALSESEVLYMFTKMELQLKNDND